MEKLIRKTDVLLAVQKAIIDLGYEPLGEQQEKIYAAVESVPTAFDVDCVLTEINDDLPFIEADDGGGTFVNKLAVIEAIRKGGIHG